MRKNRTYKKGEPFRDAQLFVIACEGERREKEYFERLGHGSQRLKVRVLAPEANQSRSAPKWLLDRLVNYIEKEGINVQTGDIVWIVMDIDRWKLEQLYQIADICRQESWGFALSNPCFEVWLFMHVKNIGDANSTTCQDFKSELGQVVKGGYNLEKFVDLVLDAVSQADALDDDFNNPIPAFKITRVHLLVKDILEMF